MNYNHAICAVFLAGHFLVASRAQEENPYADEPEAIEAISLLGKPLKRIQFDEATSTRLKKQLREAQTNFERNLDDVDAIVWLGRRLAYRWQYRASIVIYSKGIRLHPDDPRLYRHRGHRFITLREFDKAVADLQRAAELIEGTEDSVEPDGQPNAAGIPTSTLHTNIWYHLGLAHYLQGNFEEALAAYKQCLAAAKNNDMRVATLDWLYMTLRRLDRVDEANEAIRGITADMELLENHAYHRRLLLYKGLLEPSDLLDVKPSDDRDLDLATYGYGVANWYLYNGAPDRAEEIFDQVVDGKYWPAFGYIAAEAELARMRK